MPIPIAIASADWHQQDRAWKNRLGLYGDAKFSLQWIVGQAVSRLLPLLAGGDLLDTRSNEAGIIAFLITQLDRLKKVGVPLHFIQGQHEFQPYPWLKTIHDWPCWLAEGVALIGGHQVWGIDWCPRDVLQEKLLKWDKPCSIVLMHQVVEELLTYPGRAECSFKELPPAQLIIMGDFHKSLTQVFTNKIGGQSVLLSPGSIAMQSIDEPTNKYVYVVHDDLSLVALQIPTRPVLRPPIISSPEVMNTFLEQLPVQLVQSRTAAEQARLPEELVKPILVLRCVQGGQVDFNRLLSAVGEQAHVFPQMVVGVTTDMALELQQTREAWHERPTLLSLLDEMLQDPNQPEYTVAQRMLHEERPAETLRALRSAWVPELPPDVAV